MKKQVQPLLPFVKVLPLFGLMSMMLTSCATIFSGTRADVVIDGDSEEPLTIVADEQQIDSVALPATLSIRRKSLNNPIVLTSEHYDYADIIPGRKTNPWVWANYFNGFMGVPVDLATGSIYGPAQSRYFIRKRSKEQSAGAMPLQPVGCYKPVALNRRTDWHYRHEVDVLIGFGSSIADGIHYRQCRALQQLGFENSEYCGFPEYGGAVGLRYFYHLNKWLAVGGMMGYAHAYDSYDHFYGGIQAEVEPYVLRDTWCNVCTEAFYAAPAVKATWWRSGALSFYSQGALGVQYRRQRVSAHIPYYNSWPYWLFLMPYEKVDHAGLRNVHQWRLAPQLTVAGMSLGGRHLRFFMELGYGIEGVFNIGMSYRFHRASAK